MLVFFSGNINYVDGCYIVLCAEKCKAIVEKDVLVPVIYGWHLNVLYLHIYIDAVVLQQSRKETSEKRSWCKND